MYCLEDCELYKYNMVHNGGECYHSASHCERRIRDGIPILDVPEPPEEDDDDSIEDPSLP